MPDVARRRHFAPIMSAACYAPPRLLAARDKHAAGELTLDQLRAAEDEAIREVVQMQREVGLQSATDGEFRRSSWHMDFIYQLGGIEKAPGDIRVKFHNARATSSSPPRPSTWPGRCTSAQPIFAADFGFLQSTAAEGVTPKLTIPSPSMVHYRGGAAAIDPDVYADIDAFWADLTAAYADSGQGRGRARLQLPAVRRHQPGLPQRPAPARRDGRQGRGRRAPARDLHPPHQRGAGRAPAGPDRDHPHVPGQLPLLVGGRGRL